MIRKMWHRAICVLTGTACTTAQPSSRDLQKEMHVMGQKADDERKHLREARYRIIDPTGNYMADRLRGVTEERG